MIDLTQSNILSAYMSTLEKTSFDKNNGEYLSDSQFQVVDFDTVKDAYFIGNNKSNSTKCLRSNDALVIFDKIKGHFIFIEFKNGKIESSLEKEKIRSKISESLLILNDILQENLSFDRKSINYILVYNKSKNTKFENQRNSSWSKIGYSLSKLSGDTYLIDGFDRYRLFFHDVKTINEEEFKAISSSLEKNTYKF